MFTVGYMVGAAGPAVRAGGDAADPAAGRLWRGEPGAGLSACHQDSNTVGNGCLLTLVFLVFISFARIRSYWTQTPIHIIQVQYGRRAPSATVCPPTPAQPRTYTGREGLNCDIVEALRTVEELCQVGLIVKA